MTPSSEPAPGHGLQVAVIGGVLVTRDEIVKALAVLKGRPDTDTWILPRLIDIESPLARTAYETLPTDIKMSIRKTTCQKLGRARTPPADVSLSSICSNTSLMNSTADLAH